MSRIDSISRCVFFSPMRQKRFKECHPLLASAADIPPSGRGEGNRTFLAWQETPLLCSADKTTFLPEDQTNWDLWFLFLSLCGTSKIQFTFAVIPVAHSPKRQTCSTKKVIVPLGLGAACLLSVDKIDGLARLLCMVSSLCFDFEGIFTFKNNNKKKFTWMLRKAGWNWAKALAVTVFTNLRENFMWSF